MIRNSRRRQKAKASPFLDLPGELRNQIYMLVLPYDARPVSLRRKVDTEPRQSRYAALTRVCRQIRSEYFPLQRQVRNICGMRLRMSYDALAVYPIHTFFQGFTPENKSLEVYFNKSSEIHDTYVDLLPLLRANADPTVRFRCNISKTEYLRDNIFNIFLLLSRLFRYSDTGKLMNCKLIDLDAIIFKLDGTYLELRLKHDAPRWLDVDALKQDLSNGQASRWGTTHRIPDIHVIVTRCAGPIAAYFDCSTMSEALQQFRHIENQKRREQMICLVRQAAGSK